MIIMAWCKCACDEHICSHRENWECADETVVTLNEKNIKKELTVSYHHHPNSVLWYQSIDALYNH